MNVDIRHIILVICGIICLHSIAIATNLFEDNSEHEQENRYLYLGFSFTFFIAFLTIMFWDNLKELIMANLDDIAVITTVVTFIWAAITQNTIVITLFFISFLCCIVCLVQYISVHLHY